MRETEEEGRGREEGKRESEVQNEGQKELFQAEFVRFEYL